MVSMNIATTDYASKAKRLMKIAHTLRDMGAQAYIDVPKIAVLGGQSAGKSSLVEAVSDIRVPRDSGTCTRCPMEVNLISEPGPWSCSISLRFEYDATGARLPADQVRTVEFGSVLTNIEDVELMLRRAQVAILNPKQKADSFLSDSIEELQYYRTPQAFASGTLKFSKNVVVVEITNEDGVDLSFVDLPGLIQNEESQVIQIVEDLVKSNISGNCLMLVTIPMSDDIENQRAMRLALEVDDEKARTIGVLTKPDTLSVGAVSARKKWRDLITGDDMDQTHHLRHGYYCVKLPDDAEREDAPTRYERIDMESKFFKSTAPWNEINHERFGVQNLVVDLSRHLTELLDHTLPRLRDQAEDRLEEYRERLAELPPLLQVEASTEVLQRVTAFTQEFEKMALGGNSGPGRVGVNDGEQYMDGGKSFVQKNRSIYEKFKREIRRTAPDFRPFLGWNQYEDPFETLLDEEELEGCGRKGQPKDLLDVQRVIKSSLCWELPNNVPFRAKQDLIKDFTHLWNKPTYSCFETVAENAERGLKFCINKHFSRFPKLKSHIHGLVMDLFSRQKQKALIAIESNLILEKYPLFTMNDHYLSSVREKWLLRFKQVRKKEKQYELSDTSSNGYQIDSPSPVVASSTKQLYVQPVITPLERALSALKDLGFANLDEEDLVRLNPLDPYEEELIVMADVRAYFQVAYKRIIDYIPLTIEHALNQSLAQEMLIFLVQSLQIGSLESSKRLEQLLAEDPKIANERRDLSYKVDSLEKVVTELRTLQL